jgi:hypothetical protein
MQYEPAMIETDSLNKPVLPTSSITKPRKERISRSLTPQKVKKLRQETFLKRLAETGSVTQSAAHAGINLCTPYHWCEMDSAFRTAMESARAIGEKTVLALLEDEIQRRALAGKEDPGSPNLLMFRTKRLDPRYRDNVSVNVQVGPSTCVFEVQTPMQSIERSDGADPQVGAELDQR